MGVPQNGWFIETILLKWMIWGYPYFGKPPCRCLFQSKQPHPWSSWSVAPEASWRRAPQPSSICHSTRRWSFLSWNMLARPQDSKNIGHFVHLEANQLFLRTPDVASSLCQRGEKNMVTSHFQGVIYAHVMLYTQEKRDSGIRYLPSWQVLKSDPPQGTDSSSTMRPQPASTSHGGKWWQSVLRKPKIAVPS